MGNRLGKVSLHRTFCQHNVIFGNRCLKKVELSKSWVRIALVGDESLFGEACDKIDDEEVR